MEKLAHELTLEPFPRQGVLSAGLGPLSAGQRSFPPEADTGACDGMESAAEDEVSLFIEEAGLVCRWPQRFCTTASVPEETPLSCAQLCAQLNP
jgi:hypothetical protein